MKSIIFATSFSPECSESIKDENPLETLKIIREELNIQDFRLGLRWNVVEENKRYSLNKYQKYIDYLLKNNCNMCFNVGPIKVMRWPEEHIPEWVDVEGIDTVQKDSDLAKHAIEYFNNVLILLKKQYGKDIEHNPKISFQIENESYNRFGHKRIIMSDGYMLDVAKVLKEYFPQNNLMLDSSKRNDLRNIMHLFEILVEQGIYTWEQLVLGLNFYFRFPIKLLQRINPWIFSKPFSMSLGELKRLQQKRGFNIEISEAQFEPWGWQKLPGNSYDDLEYVLKVAKKAFPDEYYPKIVRLWGTEELGLKIKKGKLNSEHRKIINKLRDINSVLS